VDPGRCVPLEQLPELEVDAGLERCPDGQVYRPTAASCVHPLALDPCGDPGLCMETCEELGAGLCNTLFTDFCACQYPCEVDGDCAPNAACLCASGVAVEGGYEGYVPFSQCVPAGCRTDADCGEFRCALSPGICGWGTLTGLFCRTPDDECAAEQDCVDAGLGNLCQFAPDQQRWVCTEQAFCE